MMHVDEGLIVFLNITSVILPPSHTRAVDPRDKHTNQGNSDAIIIHAVASSKDYVGSRINDKS